MEDICKLLNLLPPDTGVDDEKEQAMGEDKGPKKRYFNEVK